MRKPLVERLEQFKETWVANPAAKLEFVNLVLECALSDDSRARAVDTWATEQRDGLRRIGIR